MPNTPKQWISLVARLGLGGLFLYASFHKISSPAAFVEAIENYHLFELNPLLMKMTNLWGLYLPWLEFFVGLFLIVGVYVEASALIISTLSGIFILAISQATLRGFSFSCGCLASEGKGASTSEIVFHIIGNLVLIAAGLWLVRYSRENDGDESSGA